MKWVKGISANPGGRPKGFGDLRELARTHTEAAVSTLVEIMNDTKAAPSARATAATGLLDRGWGRPEQSFSAVVTEESYVDVLKRINLEEEAEALTEKALPAPSDGQGGQFSILGVALSRVIHAGKKGPPSRATRRLVAGRVVTRHPAEGNSLNLTLGEEKLIEPW